MLHMHHRDHNDEIVPQAYRAALKNATASAQVCTKVDISKPRFSVNSLLMSPKPGITASSSPDGMSPRGVWLFLGMSQDVYKKLLYPAANKSFSVQIFSIYLVAGLGNRHACRDFESPCGSVDQHLVSANRQQLNLHSYKEVGRQTST